MPKNKQFWSVQNETDQNAELILYGVLGESGWFDDVGSKQFARDMLALRGKNVTVRINSIGGDIFTGQAIYSSIKQHDKKVTVYIDGLAASAASLVAMAGDEVVMPSNAMMMIHNPWTIAAGESKDFRKTADTLDKIRESAIAAYQEKTGLTEDRLIEIMDEETWLTAADAKEYGFADTVEAAAQIAASIGGGRMTVNGVSFSIDNFKTLPTALVSLASASQKPAQNPSRSAGNTEEPKERKPMNLEQLKAEHLDLYKQVLAEGEAAAKATIDSAAVEAAKKERERIKSIDDMAMKGHEDLAAKAKFETPLSAEAFAVEVVKAEKARKTKFLQDRSDDADDLNDLNASTSEPGIASKDKPSDADAQKRETWRSAAKNVGGKNATPFMRKEG